MSGVDLTDEAVDRAMIRDLYRQLTVLQEQNAMLRETVENAAREKEEAERKRAERRERRAKK